MPCSAWLPCLGPGWNTAILANLEILSGKNTLGAGEEVREYQTDLIYTRVPFSMWQPVIEGRVLASRQKGPECGTSVLSPGLSTQTYWARACGWISCISFILLSLAMMLVVTSRTVCLGGKTLHPWPHAHWNFCKLALLSHREHLEAHHQLMSKPGKLLILSLLWLCPHPSALRADIKSYRWCWTQIRSPRMLVP